MNIENLKNVKKTWGEEVWLVNGGYCGKLLIIREGDESSYHFHLQKQETFYCLKGYVSVMVEDKEYKLAPFLPPITIFPKEKHSFKGIINATILELSTHHDDNDVVRLKESVCSSQQKSE